MKVQKAIGLVMLVGSATLSARASDEIVIRSGPDRASLIELFTSEGCSSCPPAEEWLSGLKKDPRLWRTIIPIAFHVDYWDRLGWKDRFAQAEFTARQRGYATSAAGSTVYTPGFFIDGREWRGWFEEKKVPAAGDRVGVIEARVGPHGEVTLTFSPEQKFEGGTAHLTQLGFDLVSDVRRGENSGHKLRHDFVVLNHASVKLASDGKDHWTAHFDSSPTSDPAGGLAIWIETAGKPVQAAGAWLRYPGVSQR